MKIIHWNASKRNQLEFAMKKYEDALFESIRALGKDVEVERIQRLDNQIIGNIPASCLFRYRRRDADIVHATYQTLTPVVYLRRPKKFVVTVLDLIPIVYTYTTKIDISTRLQWMFTPRALKMVDRIIAISEFSKREIVRLLGVEESIIDVVYLAADGSKYYPVDKKECKQRFGFDTKEKHILVVASNWQHKRMDLTQMVFDAVRKQRKDVKLIKAGYAEKLRGDGITNTGWVPEAEMPILYNSADVFLHTSEYEGFGLPIVEAMSCGVPVVVSNKASMPEVVGSYGNMVDIDADDAVTQFADKILSCIEKGIDQEAIKQSEKFSWQKTARETLKVYECMIGDKGV